jgi:hypothetical protein
MGAEPLLLQDEPTIGPDVAGHAHDQFRMRPTPGPVPVPQRFLPVSEW